MSAEEFRRELNRLYAEATRQGLLPHDLAEMAKCSRHTLVKWIGGSATPVESARQSVLDATRPSTR